MDSGFWIDEAELRFGAVLSATLRARIEEADAVLVVASAASAASAWVALEVRHAQEHGKLIVPVYVEPVMTADLFRDYLGVDATTRTGVVAAIRHLMQGLLSMSDQLLDEPDAAVLEADLRALAVEEPDLRPLIIGCLDGGGVGYEQTALYGVEFHALDFALTALFELRRTEAVALSAAAGFRRVGAGAAALSRWIETSGDGGVPLYVAVNERLKPELVDPALELLRACDPPDSHALYQFIYRNSVQLDPQQRRSTISLVTWPVRGPERLGDVLGGVALQCFPDSPEIVQMWRRWIWAGYFDGTPCDPTALARELALAHEKGIPGLEQLHEALRSHVRGYLRSGDEQKVMIAVRHLRANVDAKSGAVAALYGEASGVIGTWQWEQWEKRDKRTANRMSHYVSAFVEEATGERNWLKAYKRFKQQVVEVEELDRLLQGEDDAARDDG